MDSRDTPAGSPSASEEEGGRPLVSVIMGSTSDWETMRHAVEALQRFGVPHERRVVSAHRTPGLMARFAVEAEERGISVIIAGAGGAAHLPGAGEARRHRQPPASAEQGPGLGLGWGLLLAGRSARLGAEGRTCGPYPWRRWR